MRNRFLAVILLTLVAAACQHPVPPVQPITWNTGAVAVNEHGIPLAGASCAVNANMGITNQDGYVLLIGVPAGPHTLLCAKDGYADGYTDYLNDRHQNVSVVLTAIVPPNSMARLTAEGQHFSAGGPFTAIEASDFMLYQHWLDGQDIRPVLLQRMEAGFNMVRVFGMVSGSLGRFIPADYGERYYDSLVDFYTALSQYGLYGEFVAFADAPTAMPDVQAQQVHWLHLQAALTSPNVLLELGNELDQPANRLASIALLGRPANVFSSHGSNGSQAWPVQPHWDYATFHTNDAPEWRRKVGHNAMEIWGGPTLTNENTRAPDRFSNPTDAYDAAAGAALLAGGSDYHSVDGKSSTPWTAQELELATAWAAGARSVPLACQQGAYKHRADLETPGILRAYQRGDDSACIVLIH